MDIHIWVVWPENPVEGHEHVETILTHKRLTAFLFLEAACATNPTIVMPDSDQVAKAHGWKLLVSWRGLEGSGKQT